MVIVLVNWFFSALVPSLTFSEIPFLEIINHAQDKTFVSYQQFKIGTKERLPCACCSLA